MIRFYGYSGCSTCKNALKWLKARSIAFEERAIRETPPTLAELKAMLAAHDGDLRPLFNTSGQDYRALGLKDKLPRMSTDEALEILSTNGNLVKRPFVMDASRGICLTGFKEDAWERAMPR
jgi:arsenate reductase (glutaredoxin)